jgi:hypothetical protein
MSAPVGYFCQACGRLTLEACLMFPGLALRVCVQCNVGSVQRIVVGAPRVESRDYWQRCVEQVKERT